MPLRLSRSVALAVALLVFATPLARATHQTDYNWRTLGWNGHSNTVRFCFDPAFPGGNFQFRAIDAQLAWNNTKSELYYRWDSYPCDDMVLEWHPIGFPYSDSTFGYVVTSLCAVPINRICFAWIHMDSTENWYTGIGTPSQSQLDLRSAVSHEWGHTTTMTHDSNSPSYVLYPTLNFGQKKYIPKCHESDTVRDMYGADGAPTCRS